MISHNPIDIFKLLSDHTQHLKKVDFVGFGQKRTTNPRSQDHLHAENLSQRRKREEEARV
jgi:hypothetical protein